MKISKMIAAAAAAAALVSTSGNAAVTNKPTTFQVSAKVVTNCTISATTMDFGNYDPVGVNAAGGSPLNANSTITVICTKGSSGVSVGLDLGLNAGAGTTRKLANAGEFLNYSIADEAGTPWAQTTTTTAGVTTLTAGSVSYGSFTSATSGVSHIAKGTLAAGQDVSVGTYTDTVTATVVF